MKKTIKNMSNQEWVNYRFMRRKIKKENSHFSKIILFFVGMVHLMAVYAVFKN
jgi:hypothetical protein